MVSVAGSNPNSVRYLAAPGQGLDGVVQIVLDIDGDGLADGFASGALLPTGRHILTAAHVTTLDEPAGDTTPVAADAITVVFTTVDGVAEATPVRVAVHPDFATIEKLGFTYDLAVLELADTAPIAADRYRLDREGDILGQDITVVGYGIPATGADGADFFPMADGTRRFGRNTVDVADGFGSFDAFTTTEFGVFETDDTLQIVDSDGAVVFESAFTIASQEAIENAASQSPTFMFDFDSGNGIDPFIENYLQVIDDPDGFEAFIIENTPNLGDSGLGLDEVGLTPGDSGSPALSDDDRIVGVASTIGSPDPEFAFDFVFGDNIGLFGQFGIYELAAANVEWIEDQYFPEAEGVSRFVNPQTGAIFLTDSDAERDAVIENAPIFYYDGSSFFSAPSDDGDAIPVHRFFNTLSGNHFYTAFEGEAAALRAAEGPLRYEGVGFFAYDAPAEGRAPIQRFWNIETGVHVFAISEDDVRAFEEDGRYRAEGVAFWGASEPPPQTHSDALI